MAEHVVDLMNQLCPFPVMHIVATVEALEPGETVRFRVNDPLALKSVPEELEDFGDVDVRSAALDDGWEITVTRPVPTAAS